MVPATFSPDGASHLLVDFAAAMHTMPSSSNPSGEQCDAEAPMGPDGASHLLVDFAAAMHTMPSSSNPSGEQCDAEAPTMRTV